MSYHTSKYNFSFFSVKIIEQIPMNYKPKSSSHNIKIDVMRERLPYPILKRGF